MTGLQNQDSVCTGETAPPYRACHDGNLVERGGGPDGRTCRIPGWPVASVTREGNQWVVVWWVGPKGKTAVPGPEKGRLWVERFASHRVGSLGRKAATPGTGPGANGAGYAVPTAEEKARYDAFIASYVPSKRARRRCR